MDAYLICKDSKYALWLGKPIRTVALEKSAERVVFYHRGPKDGIYNHEDPLSNKTLWKFLADNAHKELRVVFSGEFNEDEYEHIGSGDVETENYVHGWPEGS